MYERRQQPLLPLRKFAYRMAYSIGASILLTIIALFIGMQGYHHFEKMNWTDAFVNAAMILSGMGPLGELHSQGGKIFAGFYALFSGLTFIAIITIIIAPVFHRFIHKFHMEEEQSSRKK